ncbi:SlyX family protein [Myxococcota bacterium]|nr:SlyX family protein [Myxococcota bacterium]
MDENRITELEILFAHQQDLLHKLNDALIQQQASIDKLAGEVAWIKDTVLQMLQEDPQDRTAPPHY